MADRVLDGVLQLSLPDLVLLRVLALHGEHSLAALELEIESVVLLEPLSEHLDLLEVEDSLGRHLLLVVSFILVVLQHSLIKDPVSLLPLLEEIWLLF